MPGRLIFGFGTPTKAARRRDIPNACLRAVAAPAGALSFLDGVPARLVLPVVVAAADREMLLAPDDLTAQLEIGVDERLRGFDRVHGGMPDVGNDASAGCKDRGPVGPVIVYHVPEAGRVFAARGDLKSPGGIVVDAVWRIGSCFGPAFDPVPPA
jgi:hypothetical protein